MKRKKILFGSSFNPITQAHLIIIEQLSLQFSDAEICLVPVYKHPDPKALACYSDRLAMLNEVIKNKQHQGHLINVVISEIEKELYHQLAVKNPNNSFSIRTHMLLNYLKAQDPHVDLSFTFGADTLASLFAGNWAKGEEVIRLCDHLIYINRAGTQIAALESTSQVPEVAQAINTAIHNHPEKFIAIEVFAPKEENLKKISSTHFRELTEINSSLDQIVPLEVLNYCHKHHLYAFNEHFYNEKEVINWFRIKHNTTQITDQDKQFIQEEISRRKKALQAANEFIKRSKLKSSH